MANGPSSDAMSDLGRLVLRLVLGILILFHGVAKITGGISFVTGGIEKYGLPPALGYLVYVGEVIGPLLVIFGLWTRVGAFFILVNMIVALLLAHTSQLFMIAKTGGYQLELQAMYLFGALAVMLLGAGRYSIAGTRGRFN
jgi:putative oxidoreductase